MCQVRLSLICAALLFIPAVSLASDDHSRPTLTPAEEDAWLEHLVGQSVHRLALEAAKSSYVEGPQAAPPAANPLAPPPPPAKAWPAKKGRRVYGFLPYWTVSGTTLHWDQLTQLAWFSAELNAKGNITNVHGWGGATAKKIIAEAHSHGVQVALTITLFSKSGISAVLATASSRTAVIGKISDLVISGGGDGVNIDFEGLAVADRDKMKAFTAELNTTLKKKLPGADVTLATPAVDWGGAWDYDYLAEHCDGLFVMAYGIHYKGSNPGPQLPMASASPWNHKTLQWVVDDYFKWGKPANKHKFIIGLPLYGNSWPAASNKTGAAKLANGKAVTMENAWAAAAGKGGWKYDAASKSAWYTYKQSGTWYQTWVETPNTFAFRTEYLDTRDVQLGLWALGYADKMSKVWQSIASYQDAGGTIGPGPDAGSVDAGAADSGAADAGPTDTGGGVKDAGPKDTGPKDAGPKDAGPKDAGPKDAGPKDAGAKDTGPKDAGAKDTGSPDLGGSDVAGSDLGGGARPSDTGSPRTADSAPITDAGAPQDAAAASPVHAAAPGSGCVSAPAGAPWHGSCLLLLLAAVALLGRRKAA